MKTFLILHSLNANLSFIFVSPYSLLLIASTLENQ